MGGELDIHLPALLETRPDLVLASLSVPGMEQVVRSLRMAGLKALTLDPISVPDILNVICRIGEVIGLAQKAAEVAAQFQQDLQALHSFFPRPPRVLIEWWPRQSIAAARDSWVTDLLEYVHGVNALAGRAGRSAPLTLDEVRAAQPDLIGCSWCGAKKLRPEVIEARGLGIPVVAIHERHLGRPGPTLLQGARELRGALQNLALAADRR